MTLLIHQLPHPISNTTFVYFLIRTHLLFNFISNFDQQKASLFAINGYLSN